MGKKGSWFSAIKRVFTSNSKDKPVNEAEKRSSKEKKKGKARLKHGENRSFIPFFREPSSIEKILGEIDQQNLFIEHPPVVEQPKAEPSHSERSPPRIASPRRAASPRSSSSRVVHQPTEIRYRPEPTLHQRHLSATRIQAAYRGYTARKSFRALTGLMRLQGVVRGQHVRRQTVNAMKKMQLLVRVQTQIQSRRIQMLENQALQRQTNKNDQEAQSSFGKNLSEIGDDHWDDSAVTKEERDARLQKKVEAVIKRERAMAYAYSHQLWKGTPKAAQNAPMDVLSGGFPWWWNWLERQLPSVKQPLKNPESSMATPSRPTPDHKWSPRSESSSYKQQQKHNNFSFDNLDTPTPRSSRSMTPMINRQHMMMTPSRTPPSSATPTPSMMRGSKARGGSPYPMKDDDSLMSCPPFSAPNYMSPTASAKAKVRAASNDPKATGSHSSKRRFSFPATSPSIGGSSSSSFRWKKGPSSKLRSPGSIGDLSVNSAVSMPPTVGTRKPFNRFV